MKEITPYYLDIKAIFEGSQMEVRLHFRDVLSCLINVLYLISNGCLVISAQLPIHLLMSKLCINCNHVTKRGNKTEMKLKRKRNFWLFNNHMKGEDMK